jgi:hypothetical protein
MTSPARCTTSSGAGREQWASSLSWASPVAASTASPRSVAGERGVLSGPMRREANFTGTPSRRRWRPSVPKIQTTSIRSGSLPG